MIQNTLSILMLEELTATIEGLILLILILRRIMPKLIRKKTQSSVLYLVFGYIAVLSTTYSRAMGIYLDNYKLRFWGALISGSIGIILFNKWGTIQIKMKPKKQKAIIITAILGLLTFTVGSIINKELIKGIGLLIFALVCIITLTILLNYVVTHSPYLKAQQKVKIITIGFTLMVIFEMTGVFFMQIEQWISSTFLFLLRDISWGIVTLGILFPKRLQELLAKKYQNPKKQKSAHHTTIT